MDNINPYETELYIMAENTNGDFDKFFYDQLTPKQKEMFDDILTITIFLMQPKQRPEYLEQVYEAIEKCKKVLMFGDEIIKTTTIKPLDNGLFFGMN